MQNPFPSQFLRYVLLADALLSGFTGLLQLLVTSWLANLLQLPATLLLWTGVILVAYACVVAYLAFSQRLTPVQVWAVITVNVVWAIDCVGLLMLGWVSPNAFGVAWILTQVIVVLIFAELQYSALRRSNAATA